MNEEGVGSRLAGAFWMLMPVTVTLFLLFLLYLPYGVGGLSTAALPVAMLSVYFWTVHRPDCLPIGVSFLLGIVVDAIGGGPLGLSALALVVLHWGTLWQRRYLVGKSFTVTWVGFALLGLAITALHWLIANVSLIAVLNPLPAFIALAIVVAAYPALAFLFGRLHARLPDAEI